MPHEQVLLAAGRPELRRPDAPGPHPVVVFVREQGAGRACPYVEEATRALVSFRVAVLVLDITGERGGDCIDDLRGALDVVSRLDDVDGARIGIAAVGPGTAIALRLSAADPRIGVLVLRAPRLVNAAEAVARVSVPTLLLVDEHDELGRTTADLLLPRLACGELEIVHRGDQPFEDADTLATALTVSWLKSHLGKRPGRP